MAALARRIVFRKVFNFKQRKYSISAAVKDEDYIIRSVLPDIVVPNERIVDKLWKDIASFKNHVAIESASTGKSYKYLELQNKIDVFATSLLKKLHMKPGDVVAVMAPNGPEFPVTAFGTIQAGCVLTTINPMYKEFEVIHQITTTECKVIVTIPECYDVITKAIFAAKMNVKIVLIDDPKESVPNGVIRFSEIGESGEVDFRLLDKIDRQPDDLAAIPFSSGTTGLPKGVEITNRILLSAMEMMNRKEYCFATLTHGTHQDILPCVLPFFHIYGLVVTIFGHLCKGSKLIAIEKFSTDLYLDILEKNNTTLLYIVPPIAILLGKHPLVKKEYFRSTRYIVSGAAPLAASDVDTLAERTPPSVEIAQGWGATETASVGVITYKGAARDGAACGHPVASCSIKIVDGQGNALPMGQSGELYVKGPHVMKAYHKNELATRESLTEDGYFKTGDHGHFDKVMGLYITDRIKELIKVKGMQVAPAELESLLRSHPCVADAAVVGVPHEFSGEVPKAFIIPKHGVQITEKELQKFVADKVASFKRVEEVMFVKEIPKTASGKILRKDLKKMYC